MNQRLTRRYVSKIDTECKEHKEFMQDKILAYIAENEKITEQEQSGVFSSHYILSERNKLATDTLTDIQAEKKATSTRIESVLSLLNGELDSFFNANVTKSFADTLTAYKALDVVLSDKEFSLLFGKANNYADLRLLETFAKSRTKTERTSTIDENGNIKAVDVEQGDGYVERSVNVPNIEKAYTDIENYKNAVNGFVKYYYGDNGTITDNAGDVTILGKMLSDTVPAVARVSACNYFEHNAKDVFNTQLDEITACLPKTEQGKLTDGEKRVVDSIIDVNYPSLFKHEMSKYIDIPYFASLFERDERYSEMALDLEQSVGLSKVTR